MRKPLEQTVNMPLRSANPATGESSGTSTSSATAPPRPAGPVKILIVEDNLVNQSVLARLLKKRGVIVYVANHGEECLDRLKVSTFWKGNQGQAPKDNADLIEIDVVLMDQEMPVMDGLTCTKAIREMEIEGEVIRHVPIIGVTANARAEQIDTAREMGMVRCPCDGCCYEALLTRKFRTTLCRNRSRLMISCPRSKNSEHNIHLRHFIECRTQTTITEASIRRCFATITFSKLCFDV